MKTPYASVSREERRAQARELLEAIRQGTINQGSLSTHGRCLRTIPNDELVSTTDIDRAVGACHRCTAAGPESIIYHDVTAQKPMKVARLCLSCVYQIGFEGSEDTYIGQTSSFLDRLSAHVDRLVRNRHPNKAMQEAFNCYGLERMTVTIIEECPKSALNQREREVINMMRPSMNVRLV